MLKTEPLLNRVAFFINDLENACGILDINNHLNKNQFLKELIFNRK